MPDGMEFISQDAHTGGRVVQLYGGAEIPGFLNTQLNGAPVTFHAHYPDGTVEQVSPVLEPDTRNRSKRVRLPESFKTPFVPAGYANGGRYSGQMRRVVQCRHSRGQESPFGYAWQKTHGILEYPYPRIVGTSPGQEALLAAQRRYWLIEISAAGVFAAPFAYGNNCLDCGRNLNDYLQSAGAALDLAWAFANKNESGRVLQLLTAAQIAPAYANGSPWYAGMGWAFSASGRAAANVVSKPVYDGIDNNAILDYYETRLVSLAFNVAVEDSLAAIGIVSAGVARAVVPGHGIADGALAIVSGADQDAYNGPHVVFNVTSTAFDFNVTGSPPSPATGNVRVSNASAPATLSAQLTVGSTGRVTFRRNFQGTLWVPGAQLGLWNGIFPFLNTFNCDGPVHVFYDGEEQIITRWRLESTAYQDSYGYSGMPASFGGIFAGNAQLLWNGGPQGVFYDRDANSTAKVGPLCQYGTIADCSLTDYPGFFGSGFFTSAYTGINHGFYGAFDMSVENYSRTRRTKTSSQSGPRYKVNEFFTAWSYRICPSCQPGPYVTDPGKGFVYLRTKIYGINVLNASAVNAESALGTSALVLIPTDREAVAGYKVQTLNNTRSTTYGISGHSHSTDEIGETISNPGPSPFTNFTRNHASNLVAGTSAGPAATTENITDTTATFYLRAGGGINKVFIGVNADLAQFITWAANSKETAASGLFFMRGGMNHNDPNLSPVNQKRNSILRLNNQWTIEGGFTQVPAKVPAAFIGQI